MNFKEGVVSQQEKKIDAQIQKIENENALLVSLETQINLETEKLNAEKKALEENIKRLLEQKKQREQQIKKNNMY